MKNKIKSNAKRSKGFLKELPFKESTLEMIDESFVNYIKNLNINVETNEGWRPVPVLWATAERSFQVKHDRDIRDQSGSLILPLISIEKMSVHKNPSHKGSAWGNIPDEFDEKGGSITVARVINQDKTSNFTNAQAKRKTGKINFHTKRKNWEKKVVYQTKTIPMPVYVDIMYRIHIRTEYEQHMNTILTPFLVKPGGINYVMINSEHNHRYEGFIQGEVDKAGNAAGPGEDERLFERAIAVKVLGYLIGLDKNGEKPKISIRENAVDVKIPRERFIFGDEPDHDQKDGFGFREG